MNEGETIRVPWPGWEIEGVLGRGSYGAVYAIRRDLFGKTERSAMKYISLPREQSDVQELLSGGYDRESITKIYRSYLTDIVREYRLMAAIKGHTNIVYCDDVSCVQKDEGYGWDVYIKMELLTPLMKDQDRLRDPVEVIRLGRDMCRALEVCRSRNILHRDIKPQNIFVSETGDYKLGDFGIARVTEGSGSLTHRTGTYNYMAPEVYHGGHYDHAADLYSLGLTLYWALNDRKQPFVDRPTKDMVEAARERRFAGEPLPPPAHGDGELQAIVLRACAYRPEDRYATAGEMGAELEKLLAKQKAAPHPVKPAPIPKNEEKKPPVAPQDGKKDFPKKKRTPLVIAAVAAVCVLAGGDLLPDPGRWKEPPGGGDSGTRGGGHRDPGAHGGAGFPAAGRLPLLRPL